MGECRTNKIMPSLQALALCQYLTLQGRQLFLPNGGQIPMANLKTRKLTAITNSDKDGARALAGLVRIALAFDAALSAGVFAVAVVWGLVLPAAGCLATFAVSAFMLARFQIGGAA